MVLCVQGFQPLAGDMGVDLRGGNVGVAEQKLHHAQAGAVVDEMRGKSVAHDVRRELLAGNGARAVAADQVDLRYKGQSHEITVTQPPDNDWLSAFHAAHQRRYGHQHPEEPVEVVNARLRAVGQGVKPVFEPLPAGTGDPAVAQIGEGSVWFAPDAPARTIFCARERLLAGDRLVGPALVFQLDTTILIEPGWVAEVDEWGNIILTRQGAG